MATFLEFLRSGKSAKEFIDTAILPQHVRPVTRVPTSPEPYAEEELGGGTDDIPTPEPDDLSGADPGDTAHDIMDTAVLSESVNGDNPDDAFLRQLEAFEEIALEEGGE